MVNITYASEAWELSEFRTLLMEYAASLDVDLAYQDFQHELDTLPGDYALPRGCMLIAREGPLAMACVAVRPVDNVTCEMKRLYVRPAARGSGLGRELAMAAIQFARTSGFHAMRLDTLPSMSAAQSMYRALGFRDIAPYRFSPVPSNRYMELSLLVATDPS